MIVSIHQPNFVPWYPYFLKMAVADVFVLLNHAQYPKGKYVSRFGMEGRWYSMSAGRGLVAIKEKRYLEPQRDWERIKAALPECRLILDEFDPFISGSLWKTNGMIIRHIAGLLEISTEIVDDQPTELRGTARLVDICVRHGATKYISGPSGRNYLELEQFAKAGIEVEFHDAASEEKRPILEVLRDHQRFGWIPLAQDKQQLSQAL